MRHLPDGAPRKATAKAEATQDRFSVTKLLQELGNLQTLQEQKPKEALGMLTEAASEFGELAEDAADVRRSPEPCIARPLLAALTAHSHCAHL